MVAEGVPEVRGALSSLYITHEAQDIREIEIRFPSDQFQKMEAGVAYRLVPVNAVKGYQWKVSDEIRISKRSGGRGEPHR